MGRREFGDDFWKPLRDSTDEEPARHEPVSQANAESMFEDIVIEIGEGWDLSDLSKEMREQLRTDRAEAEATLEEAASPQEPVHTYSAPVNVPNIKAKRSDNIIVWLGNLALTALNYITKYSGQEEGVRRAYEVLDRDFKGPVYGELKEREEDPNAIPGFDFSDLDSVMRVSRAVKKHGTILVDYVLKGQEHDKVTALGEMGLEADVVPVTLTTNDGVKQLEKFVAIYARKAADSE
ncbi:hypothetical protein ACFLZ6_01700 [Nanoarchaeota archaeon]